MDNLLDLKDKRNKAVEEMDAILTKAESENRDLTAEETARWDSLDREQEKLAGQIARGERTAGLKAEMQEIHPAAARPTRIVQGGAPAKKEFESFGEFIHAVRFNHNDQRLSYQEFPEVHGEMRQDEGATGGFAVPTQFRDGLLQVTPQQAVIGPRANNLEAGDPPDAAIEMVALDQTNGSAPSNVYGGVTVSWISEGGAKPETDFKIRTIKLEPKEVAGKIIVTDKLLRNWRSSGALIQRQLRGALISAREHAFLTGNGVGRPLGIVNSGAAFEVTRDDAGSITYDDITAMVARKLGNPVWIGSQSILPTLTRMQNYTGSPVTGDGSLVWQPNARDAAGNQLLLGYPILWHERSPLLGTTGDLVLADLSYYLIKPGSGPFVAISEHVYFESNKTVIKIFDNVDGRPWLTAPFAQENTFQVSPFVTLSD